MSFPGGTPVAHAGTMDVGQDEQGEQGRPLASSTVSTTTTTGPHTITTTTSTSPEQGTTVHHSGPQSTTIISPTITTTTRTPSPIITTTTQTPSPQPPQPSPSQVWTSPSTTQRVRSRSIRIRRPTSQQSLAAPLAAPAPAPAPAPASASAPATDNTWQAGRRRSSSEPRPPPQAMFQDDSLRRQVTATPQPLQPLYENGTPAAFTAPNNGPPSAQRPRATRQSSAFHMRRNHKDPQQNMMGHNVVDVLDVIGQYTFRVLLCRLTRW
jgi:hypothetical protein